MRSSPLKAVESIRHAGSVPTTLAFQPLSVPPSGTGRCHLPQIATCCCFFLGSICQLPCFHIHTSPAMNFLTIQLEKQEEPKFLDFAAPLRKSTRVGAPPSHGCFAAVPKGTKSTICEARSWMGSGSEACGPSQMADSALGAGRTARCQQVPPALPLSCLGEPPAREKVHCGL